MTSTSVPKHGIRLGIRTTRYVQHAFVYVCIALFLVLSLMPLGWMLSTSFKTLDQLRVTVPIQWLPKPATLQNYVDGWAARDWPKCLRNTLFLAVGHGGSMLASCTLAAYAFARMRFRGRDTLMLITISLMLIPAQVTMVPRFVVMARLGWVGTWLPAIVPALLATNPGSIFMLRQFFRSIPDELSDAARIDGCSELGIFWRIVLPLSKPVIALIAVGTTAWAWNDLIFSMIYLKKEEMQTLTLAMQSFIRERGETPWGAMMAMSVLISLPMMLLSYIGQRYFTESFTLSGIKG